MRFPFIRTTQTAVMALKKQARVLSKNDGQSLGKALEGVALTACYLNRHHVTCCAAQTPTFLGPSQPSHDPFVAEAASPAVDEFIWLLVSEGPAGDDERARARLEGVRISDDEKYLMFPYQEADDEMGALCDDYSVSGEYSTLTAQSRMRSTKRRYGTSP